MPGVILMFIISIILTISAGTALRGRIVILENPNGTGFTMDFTKWTSKNKCRLYVSKNDVLQIEVVREDKDGEIALEVSGKNGAKPYSGKDLKPGVFTVTVSETDDYVFRITGKNATGKITVKNLGNLED